MRRQDDRHAALAQAVDQLPHVAAQRHVDARGRLVEEQQVGLVRQRLGDQHAALHASRQLHDLGVALVPQLQVAQQLFDIGGVPRSPEQPAREGDGRQHALERVGRQFLGDEADPPARLAIVADRVEPVDGDRPRARHDDAADDRDQRRLARAVGAEQRQDLAAPHLQVDRLERLHRRRLAPRRIGLGDPRDAQDGIVHAVRPDDARAAAIARFSASAGSAPDRI